MANITVIHDQLGNQITEYQYNGLLIDWLLQEFPDGFGAPIIITVNGRHVPVEDADYWINECDDVQIEVRSLADAGTILYSIFKVIVSIAISYAVNRLLAPNPKTPNFADAPEENPVYSLRSQRNPLPGPGEVVPVIYGDVLTTPPFGSRPYYSYTEHTLPAVQPASDISVSVRFRNSTNLNEDFVVPRANIYLHVYGPQYDYFPDPSLPPVWLPVRQTSGTDILFINSFGNVIFSLSPSQTNPYAPGAVVRDYRNSNLQPDDGGIVTILLTGTITTVEVGIQQNPGDQFYNAMFVVGNGKHNGITAADIFVGDTPLSLFDPEFYVYWDSHVDLPLQGYNFGHLNIFNRGAFWFNAIADDHAAQYNYKQTTPFHENMYTSPDVGGQDLEDYADETMWFPIGRNLLIDRIEIDIAFNRGLYSINSINGNFRNISVVIEVHVQSWNFAAEDWNVGTAYFYSLTFRNNQERTVTPFRRTIKLNVGQGMYRVKLIRRTVKLLSDGSISDVCTWMGLRGAVVVNRPVYGWTHMLLLRLKANDTISSLGQSSIRIRAKRQIVEPLEFTGKPALEDVHTSNPASIAQNIYCHTLYGGRRPLSEFDFDKFLPLYNKWKTANGFNAVFNDRVTIFEALEAVLQPVIATPLVLGSLLSVRAEQEQTYYYQLFTEQNILRDSYSVNYSFDSIGAPDGYEVKYADYDSWQQVSVIQPSDALFPQQINLFGCSSRDAATQTALYLLNRDRWARKRVTFDVELEGMIPIPGDKIGVQHSLIDYSSGGVVIDYNPATHDLTLDRDVTFEAGKTYAIMLRNVFGSAIGTAGGGWNGLIPKKHIVTQIAANIVRLDVAPIDTIITALEDNPTHYAFGSVDYVVTEYVVDTINPSDDNVFTIQATNYDARVYQNSLPFLLRDIANDNPHLP